MSVGYPKVSPFALVSPKVKVVPYNENSFVVIVVAFIIASSVLVIELNEQVSIFGDFIGYANDPDCASEYNFLVNALNTDAIGLYEDEIDWALQLLDVFHPVFFDYSHIENDVRKIIRYVGYVNEL